MISQTITYTDFNNEERTETLYFHMMKSELSEMEFSKAGGFSAYIQKIVKEEDNYKILESFKELILKAYGEKSEDGRSFIKVKNGKRLSEDFEQTLAFSELFMQLATDQTKMEEFINGLVGVTK